jgi:hypothetical protein
VSGDERDQAQVAAYVRAALALERYVFTEAEIADITLQFTRFAEVATAYLESPLTRAVLPAPVFRP